MLENERIIVQDRGGIDAGIAALMQNANKGFDPAALMAMMNNGNGMFGGNGGWWWIFIIVLFWMWGGWGGNGFGRGNQAETNSDFARLAAMGNQNNNTDLLMQAINGNKDAINTLSTNLNCDVKSIDNALCSIQNAIGKVGSEVGFSAERVINAVNAGDCNVIKAISDCCCTTATEKSQIVNMVRQSLEDCRVKKESLSKIDEEMRRCEDILKILNVNSDITTNVTKDFKELDELRAEVKELKQLLQNISTVRPEENNIDPPTEEKENEI